MDKSKTIVTLVSLILFAAIFAIAACGETLTVGLNDPANGANSTTATLSANFTAVSSNDTTTINCTLYTSGGTGANNGAVANNTPTILTFNAPSSSTYSWNVTCKDSVATTNTSETRTWNFDNSTVVIHSMYVNETDAFYSDAAGNNKLTFMVNATDSPAGIKYIIADFSELNQPGIGNVNMTQIGSTDIWNATITITNVTGMNFEPKNISIATANDSFGNVGVWTMDTGVKTVILYDMEIPPTGDCMQWGSATTNFSTVDDFAHVNFVLQQKTNLSCATPGGVPSNAPDWTHDYETVVLINFTSVDLSTPGGAQKLQFLQDAFQAELVAPHMFGTSRIYFNTSYFEELNTTTKITMYHLPFASQPNIVADADAAGTTGTITW